MHDQAKELRQLVRKQTAENGVADRPRIVVVSGAKGGVGTTTVAMNLAMTLAAEKHRTLLVDADPDAGDVALLCRLDDHPNIADVFSGKHTLDEVSREGPGEIRVVPGAWGLDCSVECSTTAQDRLLDQFKTLGATVDLILLDSGGQTSRMVGRFWQAADAVLLVTSPERLSVMDAYASIKILAGTDPSIQIHLAVNMVDEKDDSDEVHTRLQKACQRFLGTTLAGAVKIARDNNLTTSDSLGTFCDSTKPDTTTRRHIKQLANYLINALALNSRNNRSDTKPKRILSIDKIDSTQTVPYADSREQCESRVIAKL